MAHEEWRSRFGAALSAPDQVDSAEVTALLEFLSSADAALVLDVLEILPGAPLHATRQTALRDRMLEAMGARRWSEDPGTAPRYAALAHRWYGQFEASNASRHQLLRPLAKGGETSIGLLVEILVEDPPREAKEVLSILAPLFQRRDYEIGSVFPRLLDALSHPGLAAPVLDLASFATRRGLSASHPAASRAPALAQLLVELTRRLAVLEERVGAPPGDAGEPADRLAQTVDQSVALAVSLCDALALIGDPGATGSLYQALDLRHRRLKTEAAAALAALDEDAGRQALIELAAEPVARMRVLSYADELGLLDQVPDEYRTAEARAIAELAAWLAQPLQLGIPPNHLEIVDTRSLYWPGFDEPVDCFLIRFAYRFEEGEFSNIGIVGPCVHAVRTDLANLPVPDIYAAFAGWHAEADEISESDVDDLGPEYEPEVARLVRRLTDSGYDEVRPLRLGSFFGTRTLVAEVRQQEQAGIAVADANDIDWFPRLAGPRPLTSEDAYNIYKGRRLLRAFN